jgi:hypothetical protein
VEDDMATVKGVGQRKFTPELWSYIYVFLGFALAIEGTIVSLLDLGWCYSLPAYLLIAMITLYLFLRNRRFQDTLVKLKAKAEDWR